MRKRGSHSISEGYEEVAICFFQSPAGCLFLALPGRSGLRGVAGVCDNVVPHPFGFHGASPCAGRPHLGG